MPLLKMKIKIVDANTHLNQASGYGQVAAAVGAGLNNLGHDVYFEYVTGCNDSLLDKLAKKKFVHTDDTIYLWIRPPHYIKDQAFDATHKNVFLTMHESTTFEGWKSDWAMLLNKVGHIITPTEWNKKVFQDAGVTVPISVVPLGVNTNIYYPQVKKGFGILTVHDNLGSPNSRENWQMTIDAFNELFTGRNAYLTIKSWNVRTMPKEVEVNENINCISSTLFPQDMAKLYQQHQVFVKNSNKEGWSVPLTEAMACGMSIICYDNPVLRENARAYPFITWFKTKDQLKFRLDAAYKPWRDEVKIADTYSWKNSVVMIEQILKTI